MNVLLFCNRDLESNFAYNLLKPALVNHNLYIFLSESVGNKSDKPDDLQLLEHFEKDLFYEIPQLLTEQGLNSSFEFFDENFSSAQLEVCQNVNAVEFVEKISDLNPDLFISIRFGKIFRNNIISIPKFGVINLHSGILPDYRGILGTLHALREGRREVGCTLHFIDDRTIDTGKIIDIAYLPVDHNHSLFWHVLHLYPLGCSRIKEIISELQQNKPISTRNQELMSGHYYSVPNITHFTELKERGFEIINPSEYLAFLKENISSDLIVNISNRD